MTGGPFGLLSALSWLVYLPILAWKADRRDCFYLMGMLPLIVAAWIQQARRDRDEA